MDVEKYLHSYKGRDRYLNYFTEHALKEWSFAQFKRHFESATASPSEHSLVSAYLQSLKSIKRNKRTPYDVLARVQKLIEEVTRCVLIRSFQTPAKHLVYM